MRESCRTVMLGARPSFLKAPPGVRWRRSLCTEGKVNRHQVMLVDAFEQLRSTTEGFTADRDWVPTKPVGTLFGIGRGSELWP